MLHMHSPLSNNINVKKLKGNPEHMEVPLQFVSTTENICYESTCLPEGDRIYETILDNGVGYKNLCPHPVSATIIYENLMASTDPLYSNILQSSSSQPISVATFHNHVHRMHMNGDKGFEQEHFQVYLSNCGFNVVRFFHSHSYLKLKQKALCTQLLALDAMF